MSDSEVPALPSDPGQVAADLEAAGKAAAIAAVEAATEALSRRGYLQTENYILVVSPLISTVLAHMGIPGPEVAQIAAVAAPMVIAGVVAVLMTLKKRALAELASRIGPI